MAIVFSLVARNSTVLAEKSLTVGNFEEVARQMLNKISPQPGNRSSYAYEQNLIHYLTDDTLTFLCIAEKSFGVQIPFKFLADIQKRWYNQFQNQGSFGVALSMNNTFSGVLSSQMAFFNNPSNDTDSLHAVRNQLDSVKNVMSDNIEKVLERGERIELLVDKTQNLESQTMHFQKASNKLKWQMYIKNIKMTVGIILIILFIALAIFIMICGITFKCLRN